jgi:hypothetical protein
MTSWFLLHHSSAPTLETVKVPGSKPAENRQRRGAGLAFGNVNYEFRPE